LAVVLLGACSNQMQPAKQALDGADSAVSTASPDASQYDPEKLATLRNRLADLHAAFDRKDYASVLSYAPGISTDANALAQKVASKKQAAMAALASQWESVAASVPQLMAAVKARIDTIGKSRHVPKGIDLSAGESAFGDATGLWDKAQSSSTGGNLADAVNSAKDATAKLESAAEALRIKLPAADTATK
jgi:hypothetical protein